MQNIISSHLSASDYSYIDESYKNSAYDDNLRILLIHFHTNNSIYAYNNVSVTTYRQLLQAPSQGRYFWQHIRRDKLRYPFVLVAKDASIITQKHFEMAFDAFRLQKKGSVKETEKSALYDVYPDLKKLDKYDTLQKRLDNELDNGKIDENAHFLASEKIQLDKQKSIDKLTKAGYFDNELDDDTQEQEPRFLWWMFKSFCYLCLFVLCVVAFCFFVYYLLPFVVFIGLGLFILALGCGFCR